MMRKLLLAFLLLASVAGAQTVTRKITPYDLKYQVGSFDRASQVTPGTTVSRPGFTPINALSRGIDSYGIVACSDSLNALIVEVGEAGGGDIYLPPGYYRAKDPITIRYDNVSLIGAGAGSTVIFPTWDGSDSRDFYNTVRIVGASNVVIRDIGVKGARCTGDCENSGIAIQGGFYNTIAYCQVDSCDNAGILVGYDWDGYFDLAAADRVDPTSAAVDEIDGWGHIIIGNIVSNTHGGCAIEIMRADSCIVSNNNINGALQHGIRVDASWGTAVSGNMISGAEDNGISIQGYGDSGTGVIKTAKSISVVGNVINSETGINLMNGAEDISIVGNIIRLSDSRLSSPCIMLDYYRVNGTDSSLAYAWKNVTISGNTLFSGQDGIKIRGAGDGLTISDNSIGEWYNSGIIFDADYDDGIVVENATIDGNYIWYKDRYPSNASHYFINFEGDSCWVNIGRNRMSAPSVAPMSYYSFMYLAPEDSASSRMIRVGVVNVEDFGIFGDGSERDRKNLNQLGADLFRLSGYDSTSVSSIDMYFGGRNYPMPSGTIWHLDSNIRATGPSAPRWLRGGRPRDLWGSINPEGSVTAPVGSIYRRADDDSTLYVKTSNHGKTGWVLQ